MHRSLLFLFAVGILVSCQPTASDNPQDCPVNQTATIGLRDSIQSTALGEKRYLNYYLPAGYQVDSAATYPVVYLLDGSKHEDFPHIAGLMQFLNMYEIAPKMIVVGIENVDRYRDFTYPSKNKLDLEEMPTSGGSAAFMQFIEEELQPHITQKLRTTAPRTLIGQSMGGLLATEVLMRKPDLFEQYFIISPSLWWDDQSLVPEMPTYFQSHPELNKRVFVSLGEEHPVMHEVADKLVEAMRNSENPSLEVHYEPILTENHATILHKAVYLGFERLYPKQEDE
ncbi:alpha/beta hydrolase-fold protein [Pontibacter sp. G13]|uniref:alpha/beta hydrolase n=1 Tax=Pontibacter sp. G13 TaxID=3074898 RepID=UPI00288913F9|nr:alpha/beta hydrolase-fold protein [Pontibacter sp. G13]WNJ17096.1 alpha/beta hydrolase-fold protein [Pontibacter sp. G13]